MGDCCIDVVCTLVNTIVAQVVAFKDLQADARELHRHLGNLRGLLEQMLLTPEGERALKTPEANRALLVSCAAILERAPSALRRQLTTTVGVHHRILLTPSATTRTS